MTSCGRLAALIGLLLQLGPAMASAGAVVLTATGAEQLAEVQDVWAAQQQARAKSLTESALAKRQLPDPQLKMGLANFPVDSFAFDREPMTQLVVGLQQGLPKRATRRLASERLVSDAELARIRAEENRLRLLRDTRLSWLDVYFQEHAFNLLNDSTALFSQLIEVATERYAAGRGNHQDIIRAQLELDLLKDRLRHQHAGVLAARAALAEWIGQEAASRPLSGPLPLLEVTLDSKLLEQSLPEHPVLRVETQRLRSSELEIAIADQDYRPDWMLSLSYGLREGTNADGRERPDFLSLTVGMDLPLFPTNRQDRRRQAALAQADAAVLGRQSRLRELMAQLRVHLARHEELVERKRLYERNLLTQAHQNVHAALHTYRSDTGDFTALIRAQITELDVRVKAMQVAVELEKTRTRLRYLAAQPSLEENQ